RRQLVPRKFPDTRHAVVAAVIAVAAVFSILPAHAQTTAASGARPTLTAARAAQAPVIDGRLDDAVWRTAALIDTLVQEEPIEGAPATEKTEVRVAYDNE